MSKISNIPKKRNFLIAAIRELMEHRATWLALVLKEVGKKGIEWEEVGSPAVRACGHMHGQGLVDLSGTSSLKGLKKKLFSKPAQMIFDMKILKSTDTELSIDFGFCPLVAAWQKLDCTDEEIAKLCDIAMEGDRGIAESFGGRLELGETIANGHKHCQLRFKK
ncbi:MAG: L-2-amino-thiazoline-4-carboxylic acid hydrolase [Proteobacteria bacterium]|nr:L-2-amino-thiazoline-4-carboxylic acid hydrolase [Pseudomonadota bacterium]